MRTFTFEMNSESSVTLFSFLLVHGTELKNININSLDSNEMKTLLRLITAIDEFNEQFRNNFPEEYRDELDGAVCAAKLIESVLSDLRDDENLLSSMN